MGLHFPNNFSIAFTEEGCRLYHTLSQEDCMKIIWVATMNGEVLFAGDTKDRVWRELCMVMQSGGGAAPKIVSTSHDGNHLSWTRGPTRGVVSRTVVLDGK